MHDRLGLHGFLHGHVGQHKRHGDAFGNVLGKKTQLKVGTCYEKNPHGPNYMHLPIRACAFLPCAAQPISTCPRTCPPPRGGRQEPRGQSSIAAGASPSGGCSPATRTDNPDTRSGIWKKKLVKICHKRLAKSDSSLITAWYL